MGENLPTLMVRRRAARRIVRPNRTTRHTWFGDPRRHARIGAGTSRRSRSKSRSVPEAMFLHRWTVTSDATGASPHARRARRMDGEGGGEMTDGFKGTINV